MGRRNPESTSTSHVAVTADAHARLRRLSADKNVTMKQLVDELLRIYDAHVPTLAQGETT
jgi:hypothetical protein